MTEIKEPGARGPRVGELERAVLEVLWSENGAEGWWTVREVYDVLAAERNAAYTTVMTVLGRMVPKGLVEQERAEKAYRYRAAGSRGEMAADLMRQALGSVAEDSHDALVAFVGEATEAERAALRDALARLEG
ncbi:MAG: BlaI/MecI/CopY family transcriptional regulator [Nocardioides sp.]|nr:BlaI/MecI/CopY family transcriptional regulator [Nocardioides sp.]